LTNVNNFINKTLSELKKPHIGFLIGVCLGFFLCVVLQGLENSIIRIMLFLLFYADCVLTIMFFQELKQEKPKPKKKKDKK